MQRQNSVIPDIKCNKANTGEEKCTYLDLHINMQVVILTERESFDTLYSVHVLKC